MQRCLTPHCPFSSFPWAPTALRYFWKSTTASVFKIQTSASRPRMQPQLFWPLTLSRAPCPTRLSLSSVSSSALGGRYGSPGDKEEGHTPQHSALHCSGLGAPSCPRDKRKASVGRSMSYQHVSCRLHLQVNPWVPNPPSCSISLPLPLSSSCSFCCWWSSWQNGSGSTAPSGCPKASPFAGSPAITSAASRWDRMPWG